MAFTYQAAMRTLTGAALCLALAGCGAGTGLDGSFGAQDTGVAGAGGSAAGVQSGGPLTVGTGPNAVEYECPGVTVRSGASAWQVPAQGGGLRYQGSLGTLARECAIANGQTMTVKVGIEGRVLLGDKGTPGTLNVPIRVAVVEEGPEPKSITTKFFVVPVNIPGGETQAAFSVVEDTLSFPVTTPKDVARYVIYVGFDPKGEPTAKPKTAAKPRSTPRPARPKPAAAPQPSSSSAAPSTSSAPAHSANPDVFGPPPGSSSSSSSSSGSGQFGPLPGAFGPPPH